MNEHDLNLPPNLHAALENYFTEAMPDAHFTARLEEQLCRRHSEAFRTSVQPHQWRILMKTLRTRPILAILVALAALLVLSGIVYAVMNLAGFIPKVGFVEDVQSMLTTPITVQRNITAQPEETQSTFPYESVDDGYITSQEQQGVTITIEQAVSEPDQLILVYRISGLPQDLFLPERAETLQAYAKDHVDEPMPVQVRLADGRLLNPLSGGHCAGASDLSSSWLSCRSLLSPLPADVTQFTLEISRLQNAYPGELPENWKIPIILSPLESGAGISSSQEQNICSQTISGLTWCLLKTNQSTSQTAFQFSMQWIGENKMLHHAAPTTLQDSQNRYFILSGGPDQGNCGMDSSENTILSTQVTTQIDGSSPLTFRLGWIAMSAFGQSTLQFKPEQNAIPGQEWILDETITVNGFDLHFTKARLRTVADGQVTYEFDIEVPDNVISVNLSANVNSSTMENGVDTERGLVISRLTIPETNNQPIELTIFEVVYRVDGPWQINWQPEAMDFSSAPTATPLPTRMAEFTPNTMPDQPLYAEVAQILQSNFSIDAKGEPVWVKQVLSRRSSPPSGFSSADILVLPEDTLVETWTHINAEGYADTSITLISSMQGEVLYSMIHHDQYYFSIPEYFGSIADNLYLEKPSFDQNISSLFSGYLAQGAELTKEAATCDGETGTVYSIHQIYNPPMVFANEPKPVQSMEISVCINAHSNKIMYKQNRMRYTDGTSAIKETTRFNELSVMQILPDEIQAQLDRVIMP